MKSAPHTKDEKKRIAKLQSYNILDTLSEQSFDDITAIASYICKTPIALVSLVDSDRQWFKSKVGLDAVQTGRDVAFCAHAIHGEEVFQVTDASKDARFFDNPLVTGGPNVIFYAGAPLNTPEGHKMGTLCVIDSVPRELSDEQKEVLMRLARQVSEQLEHRLLIRNSKMAEDDASEKEKITKTILNNLADGVVTISSEGIIESFNRGAESIFQYSASEVVGKSMVCLMPELFSKNLEGFLKHYISTNNAKIIRTRREVCGKRKDGSPFPLSLAFSKIELKDRIILTGLVRDISESKKNIEKINALQRAEAIASRAKTAVLDAADFSIISTDLDGTILSFNKTAERMLGYGANELIEKQNPGILHEPNEVVQRAQELSEELGRKIEPGFEVFVAKAKLGQYEKREWTYISKDGTKFPVLLTVTALTSPEGEIYGFLGTAEDISELKKFQNQLIKSREEALEATKAKSNFLANMSHELRTPLNAIIGYSELLIEEAEEDNTKGIIPDLDKIRTSGTHLLNLINQVLDISKVEAGKMEVYNEIVDINAFINEMNTIVFPSLEGNNNKIKFQTNNLPANVKFDHDKVKQIIINLISNANKFSDNSEILVEFFKTHQQGKEHFVIEVKDGGIGIPEDKIEDIFGDFTQADESTTRNYGGTGLGLSICKKFAEILDGTLSAESEVGTGSRFRLTLPFIVLNNETEIPNKHNVRSITKMTSNETKLVILIDDDQKAREITHRTLVKEGFQVREAHSGQEGIRLAHELKPALIILDVMMPGKDGWETLTDLKSSETTKEIPVIMMTLIDNQKVGFTLGASDYLIKPVKGNTLISSVKKFVNLENQNILIVDDDPVARDLSKKSLQKLGIKITEASNGKEALKIIDSPNRPNIILLDLMMPVMNGLEFLSVLKDRGIRDEFQIIIISAKTLDPEDKTNLNKMVQKIIQKGNFSPNQLIEDVRSLLHFETNKQKQAG